MSAAMKNWIKITIPIKNHALLQLQCHRPCQAKFPDEPVQRLQDARNALHDEGDNPLDESIRFANVVTS